MTDLDEARLIEKLRAIQALHARPGSEGERAAAHNARERILERLRELADTDPPVEYRFSMADKWSRRVFLALRRRYDIRPYRYRGQRHTTVMAQVSKGFVDETLWPEFQALSSTLRSYLDEVTSRVVAEVIHADVRSRRCSRSPSSQARRHSTVRTRSPRSTTKLSWLREARENLDGVVLDTYEVLRPARRMLAGRPPVRRPVRRGPKVGRNDPCPCASGKKYKKRCLRAAG